MERAETLRDAYKFALLKQKVRAMAKGAVRYRDNMLREIISNHLASKSAKSPQIEKQGV